jgi:hypothetical protein
MAADTNVLSVYRDLADCYEARGEEALRDRFLVLAADAAYGAGQADEAERLRQRLLLRNRNHLLKPFHSFAQALRSPDVKLYLSELRKTHPPEAARQLLERVRGPGGPQDPGSSTARPAFPPTAADINMGDDATWLPDMSRPAPDAGGFNLEATADLDATAALENLGAAPERLDRTEHIPAPRTPPTPGRAAGRERPLPRPAPPARTPAPGRAAPPARTPLPPTPAAPQTVSAGSSWLAVLLGLVAILAGLGLLAFMLARPFMDGAQ